ncbi:hypothetical protein LJC49_02455 [Ruminococcaceae bacterium OttesenSCG-928-I18]|nr:hypothetical protein [Ruminococcaceae bacterium OttesenSCG-928-I18]
MDIKTLLLRQFSLYSAMEMEDVVKLLYQSEFGGGHAFLSQASFSQQLEEELACEEMRSMPKAAIEEIGGGYYRVPLSLLKEGPSVPTMSKLSMLSSRRNKGSWAGFLEKLKTVQGMISSGQVPLSEEKWNAFLQDCTEETCLPLHHSKRFKALYKPHYRVLEGSLALFLPVFAAVDHALSQKPHTLLGIDGMCASGKSTLASLLNEVYDCGIVYTDDFFLRYAQRTPKRLDEPGGNIDYERLAPVALQAADDRAFSYPRYNCATGEMGEERQVPAAALTVLEGVYALHPKVNAACDIRVFLMVDSLRQAARIKKRSPAKEKLFFEQWIPQENAYFVAFSIRESCDVVIDTTALDDEIPTAIAADEWGQSGDEEPAT